MSIDHLPTETSADAVSRLLSRDNQDWSTPRAADTLHESAIIERFDRIKNANLEVLGEMSLEADIMLFDYEESVRFAIDAFKEYRSVSKADETYDWGFFVPARGRHASEVAGFLPILSPQYGATPNQVHRTVAHLAPTKIETYQGTDTSCGMIVYVPAYFDNSSGADRARAFREEVPAARRRTIEAIQFARRRHNVALAGLGAVLPAITGYGRILQEPGLVTTTGHGGTVHLLSHLLEHAITSEKSEPRVGMLGLGSIGGSALSVLRESSIIDDVRSVNLYDIDEEKMRRYLTGGTEWAAITMRSVRELLNQSDIIVAAVTRVFDLDEMELADGRPINLEGKIIIDDSQPGCFDRDQVERRGGKLVWVVGSDNSESKFLHRTGGYTFGDETGLYGKGASWGCEAEAGALATLGRYDLGLTTEVSPEKVHEIGKVMDEANIDAAWPPQSFGRPVEF